MDGTNDKLKEKYKERLETIIAKKIRTTMIGSLAAIEEHFGELLEEPHNKELFDEIRTQILDLGNKQIRNIKSELERYDVFWKRYTLTLPIKEGR